MSKFDNGNTPSWDGSPLTWQQYVDSVKVWLLGQKLCDAQGEPQLCVAARLIEKLSGPARTVALQIPEAQLWPDPPTAVDTPVPTTPPAADATETEGSFIHVGHISQPKRTREQLSAGVKRLIDTLQRELQPELPLRKGIIMAEFFGSRHFWRRPNESIQAFIARWDEAVIHLKQDGIAIEQVPDILGYFLIVMLNLSPERRERLLAKLPDEHYNVELLKKAALRLFPELGGMPSPFLGNMYQQASPPHQQQQLMRRFNPRPKFGGQRFKPRFSRQAYEAALEAFEFGDDELSWADATEDEQAAVAGDLEQQTDEFADDECNDDLDDAATLQDLARQELDALADLDEVNIDPEDAVQVDAAAGVLMQASEALATLRDVRGRYKRIPQRRPQQPQRF